MVPADDVVIFGHVVANKELPQTGNKSLLIIIPTTRTSDFTFATLIM